MKIKMRLSGTLNVLGSLILFQTLRREEFRRCRRKLYGQARGIYGNNYDVLIAGSMFGILPIFVVFLLFQKYIIDGMTAGAVKG